MPLFGPAAPGKQAAQASLLEGRLRLIDGGARNAEIDGHIDNRDFFHVVSAQHLVADCVRARHYGFTAEELDLIINDDIKYRLGRDAENTDGGGE